MEDEAQGKRTRLAALWCEHHLALPAAHIWRRQHGVPFVSLDVPSGDVKNESAMSAPYFARRQRIVAGGLVATVIGTSSCHAPLPQPWHCGIRDNGAVLGDVD